MGWLKTLFMGKSPYEKHVERGTLETSKMVTRNEGESFVSTQSKVGQWIREEGVPAMAALVTGGVGGSLATGKTRNGGNDMGIFAKGSNLRKAVGDILKEGASTMLGAAGAQIGQAAATSTGGGVLSSAATEGMKAGYIKAWWEKNKGNIVAVVLIIILPVTLYLITRKQKRKSYRRY